MRRAPLVCLVLAFAVSVASGCIRYSSSSSSSSGSTGFGSGGGGIGGGSGGSSSGTYGATPLPGRGPERPAQPTQEAYAWDPSLGVYHVTAWPGVYWDGHAFYRRDTTGWSASRDGSAWAPVNQDAIPPGLRGR
jgi:hypothetical protein